MLKKELGLDDEDIIDLPILFKVLEEKTVSRAVAYYPDMVQHIFKNLLNVHSLLNITIFVIFVLKINQSKHTLFFSLRLHLLIRNIVKLNSFF